MRPSRPGRPADPPFDGMWWLYLPIAFPDFAIVLIVQEEPDGFRVLNDATRVWPDGRVEQLGWPRVQTNYVSGTRTPKNGVVTCTTPDGTPVTIEVESLLAVPIAVGGGYGGDPDWGHGQWKGAGFAERLTYDMNDPAVVGRVPFGLTDSVGRAVWREEGQEPVEGWGLYEHGVIGKHEPTGFTDWFIHAPYEEHPCPTTATRSSSTAGGRPRPPPTCWRWSRPHSEQVVARVPEGSTGDIDAAVAAARRAFDEGPWPRMSPAGADRRRPGVLRAVRRQAGRDGRPDHPRDGLADVVLQPGAVAGPVDADRGVPRDRPGVPVGGGARRRARLPGRRTPRAGRRGGRDPAVERPAVHDHVQAGARRCWPAARSW